MLEQEQEKGPAVSLDAAPTAKTVHKILYADSRDTVDDLTASIDLVVTSPPYPMIKMWDHAFSKLNAAIQSALSKQDGDKAFELMHGELDKVWTNAYRSLRTGGIMCVNVGDATRTVNGTFKLYPNHARILSFCLNLGFHALPEILWRKESNKPNKFMGSGMLPGGAYVTQEHEFILILRKNDKRQFTAQIDKQTRQSSAFFWEERNTWFSDLWQNLKGTRQMLNHEGMREKSAAFPFDLAYRLISMFSVKGDWIADPFLGTGTTTLASMALARNSLGFEIDPQFKPLLTRKINRIVDFANDYNRERISRHLEFAKSMKREHVHRNEIHGFPVVTSQERFLEIPSLRSVTQTGNDIFEVDYFAEPLKVGIALF